MFDSVLDLDAAQCVAAVEANERTLTIASCRRLVLAAQWADLHPGEAIDPHGPPGGETPSRPGGEGTPAVAGFAAAELGLLLATTSSAASRLIGDALDLRHRLPRCWARVLNAEIPASHARRTAQQTHHLSQRAAALFDVEIAPKLGVLSYGRLDTCLEAAVYKADPAAAEAAADDAIRDRFVRLGRGSEHGLKWIIARATAGDAIYFDAMVARLADILGERGDTDPLDARRSKAIGILAQPAEALRLLCEHAGPDDHGERPEPDPDHDHRSVEIVPPPFDPARARPRAVVYVHLAAEALAAGRGVGRMETIGPVLLTQIRHLLGGQISVRLQPVIDLTDEPVPVDCYEIPVPIREHVVLRNPVDRFPFANGVSRHADLDHTVAYRSPEDGGPAGQTRVNNLALLGRFHHRVKTHGRWGIRQPEATTTVWRTPHGRIYLVNASGSHPLGHGPFARAVWDVAGASPIAAPRAGRSGTPARRVHEPGWARLSVLPGRATSSAGPAP